MNSLLSPRRSSSSHPVPAGALGTLALLACTVTGCALDEPSGVEPDDLSTVSSALVVPAGPVTLSLLSHSGSGCPLGTVAVNLSEDRAALTTRFTELVAEVGPGIPLMAGRKNCVVSLALTVPAGWQYTLGPAHLRAFVALDAGMRESFSTSAFFAGTASTRAFQHTTNGPYEADLVVSDRLAFDGLAWSPCNVTRALTLNTSVRVSRVAGGAASAQGLFTIDSIDGEVTEVIGLLWRRCP